ncbi:MAG: hypothetical protein KAS93_01590 [Gammaproteobacteria bacterium]|nr:hypothetical protein [Gammaproteobacteria bacterium]
MLRYKNFLGRYSFDVEARIFHGQVINIKDVITFQGRTRLDVEQAFIDSIEDHLDFCT